MAERDSIERDTSNWLTPRQALEILKSIFDQKNLAANELLERLRGGMVTAICAHTTIDGRRLRDGRLNQLASSDWDRIYANDQIWATGTHSGSVYKDSVYNTGKAIRFFDVRFDPDEINAIVALHHKGPLESEREPAEIPDIEKKPTVSSAHLEAWFEFYKKITSSADETEDYAWAHAKQCLPNRTVSRDKIRLLRGAGKRGPKPKLG